MMMKRFGLVLMLVCALVTIIAFGGGAVKATAAHRDFTPANVVVQDTEQNNSAASDLSGNWELSWNSKKGGQKQATLQISQNGSELTGTFQGERGSVPLTGSVHGSKVSFSAKAKKRQLSFSGTLRDGRMSGKTQQGASWSATRQ